MVYIPHLTNSTASCLMFGQGKLYLLLLGTTALSLVSLMNPALLLMTAHDTVEISSDWEQ